MIPTIIHDPLGLDSGIKVSSVRSSLDRNRDCILIRGHLSGDRMVGPDLEPDLQCDVINKKDQICLSGSSTHQGVYSVTKKVTFTLKIEAVSQSIDWDDIAKISLYVIFRKPRYGSCCDLV